MRALQHGREFPQIKLKHLVRAIPGGTPATDREDFWEDGTIPWISIGDMSNRNVVGTTAKTITETARQSARLQIGPAGSVLFAMYASVGEVAMTEMDAIWNQALIGLVPKHGSIDPRFLQYSLLAAKSQLPLLYRSNTQNNVNADQVLNLAIPAPSLVEQQRVADYLDHETTEIDAFISDLRAMRKRMHERRESERAWVLTDASLAGSAGHPIPWADGLYTPYAVQNIRRVAQMKTGHTPSRGQEAYWEDVDIPWFTLADVWQLRRGTKFVSETKESISAAGVANSAAEILPAGTVVLSRTASVGFTGIMQTPMATSQDYWNWVCGPRMLPEYLWHQFRAMRQQFSRLMSGSTHKTIYQADAAGLRVVVPPIEQQKRALERLDADDRCFEELVHDAERAIELATERRAALIAAAVTGQIDVTQRHRPVAEELEKEVLQKT